MTRKRNLSKDLVIQSAAQLADQQGLDQVTMGNLAQCLKVQPASLYNHVNGLEEVRQELTKFVMQQLEETIASACVGKAKKDALRAIGLSYRRFAKEHPQWYRAYIGAAKLSDPQVDEAAGAIVRVFQQVLAAYNLTACDITHFARFYRSALHGFVSLEGAGYFQKGDADIEESYLRLMENVIAVLEK